MRPIRAVLLCALFILAACGGPGAAAEVTVTDHADALTTGGTDNLATVTLTKSDKAYDFATLEVTVAEPGQTALMVNTTLNDTNGDGKFGQGDSLTLKEPGLNKFDATSAGKAYNVAVYEKDSSGVLREIGEGTWTAN